MMTMCCTEIYYIYFSQVSYYLGTDQQVVLCIQDVNNSEPHLAHVSLCYRTKSGSKYIGISQVSLQFVLVKHMTACMAIKGQ